LSEVTCPGDCCNGTGIDAEGLEKLTRPGNDTAENLILLDMLVLTYWTVEGGIKFACKRWDRETRLCTRYDERPLMCSAYPYGRGCEYCSYGTLDGSPSRWKPVAETGIWAVDNQHLG
jgi:Fe-S-cluster containining protein